MESVMPPSTRDYGVARDCAVCGARIKGTPKFEITIRMSWKPDDLRTFPVCEYCENNDRTHAADMIHRRIASGAYKVVY